MKEFSGGLVVFGKGKAMNVFCELLTALHIEYTQMDDNDVNKEIVESSKVIIATPGIKPSHRLYQQYSKKIMSELSFIGWMNEHGYFPRRKNLVFVGITGTNGKSTTTRALYQACTMIEANKRPSDRAKVLVGGNFDRPLSGLLLDIIKSPDGISSRHIIVLEASSFMLRKLQHMWFDVGVLLNISSAHIDRHGSMKDYLQAKLTLLRHSDYALTQSSIKKDVISDQMRGISLLHRLWPFPDRATKPKDRDTYTSLSDFSNSLFPGEHNKQNFGAVDKVLRHLYTDYDKDILDRLQAVSHRLEHIPCRDKKTIVDDSVSSSPHALRAAFESINHSFIAVSGGYNNGENYSVVFDESATMPESIILYGEMRAILYPLAKQYIEKVVMVETLDEALKEAWQQAKDLEIDTILYSPGAKSFDQFDNVYHRIQVFQELMKQYI